MTTATGIAIGRVPTPHGTNRSETLGDAISVPRRVGLTATLDSNDTWRSAKLIR